MKRSFFIRNESINKQQRQHDDDKEGESFFLFFIVICCSPALRPDQAGAGAPFLHGLAGAPHPLLPLRRRRRRRRDSSSPRLFGTLLPRRRRAPEARVARRGLLRRFFFFPLQPRCPLVGRAVPGAGGRARDGGDGGGDAAREGGRRRPVWRRRRRRKGGKRTTATAPGVCAAAGNPDATRRAPRLPPRRIRQSQSSLLLRRSLRPEAERLGQRRESSRSDGSGAVPRRLPGPRGPSPLSLFLFFLFDFFFASSSISSSPPPPLLLAPGRGQPWVGGPRSATAGTGTTTRTSTAAFWEGRPSTCCRRVKGGGSNEGNGGQRGTKKRGRARKEGEGGKRRTESSFRCWRALRRGLRAVVCGAPAAAAALEKLRER